MKSKPIILICMIAALWWGRSGAAESDAAKAFTQLTDNLQMKSKMLSPYDYVSDAEKALTDFIAKYPSAPEAGQAHLLLGRLYSSIGAPENAIRNLEEYLRSSAKKSPDELAQVYYGIGANYMSMEKYDQAEKYLREVAKQGSGVDPRLTKAASGDLARLGALKKLKIGSPAVEISAQSHDGKKIRLKDYRGKVVLLDFWAVWCNPCRIEMPNVIRVYNDFRKKGFEIIGISLDSDEGQFRTFIKDNKMSWPQVYDGKGWASAVGQLYAITSIPATYLIDKHGKIRFKNVRGDNLRQAVQQLLSEK